MKIKTKDLVYAALIAGLYYTFCSILAPISYGQIQCRLSDGLICLCTGNNFAVLGMTIGTAISNLSSPLGIIDVAFGTLATLLGCVAVRKTGSMVAAAIIYPIIVGAVIGAEISIVYHTQYIYGAALVAVGTFASSIIGIIVFRLARKQIQLIINHNNY